MCDGLLKPPLIYLKELLQLNLSKWTPRDQEETLQSG
jgi:hypothetical protein